MIATRKSDKSIGGMACVASVVVVMMGIVVAGGGAVVLLILVVEEADLELPALVTGMVGDREGVVRLEGAGGV